MSWKQKQKQEQEENQKSIQTRTTSLTVTRTLRKTTNATRLTSPNHTSHTTSLQLASKKTGTETETDARSVATHRIPFLLVKKLPSPPLHHFFVGPSFISFRSLALPSVSSLSQLLIKFSSCMSLYLLPEWCQKMPTEWCMAVCSPGGFFGVKKKPFWTPPKAKSQLLLLKNENG